MNLKQLAGNIILVATGYFGSKAFALAAAYPQYKTQFNDTYSLVGFGVPNWLGIVLYILFLVWGTWAGGTQETPVDKHFKKPYMKPLASFGFGVLMTLFVLPTIHQGITIWGLILPAAFFGAIGGAAVYYIVAFFYSKEVWLLIKDSVLLRVGINPRDTDNHGNN